MNWATVHSEGHTDQLPDLEMVLAVYQISKNTEFEYVAHT
jgi:hypothetical protein